MVGGWEGRGVKSGGGGGSTSTGTTGATVGERQPQQTVVAHARQVRQQRLQEAHRCA